jgi:hypothetical protein
LDYSQKSIQIESGEICAQIDRQNGMVHFRDATSSIEGAELDTEVSYGQ